MRALGGGVSRPCPRPPPKGQQCPAEGRVWRGNWAQGLRESSGIQDSSQDTDATGYPVARVPWSKRFCAPRSNTLAPSWDSSSRNWAFDETASISKPLTKLGGWKTIQMRRFYHFGYFPNRVSCFRRFPQEVGFQNFGAQICKMDLRASGFKVAWLGKWSRLLKGLVEKCSGSKMFQKCVPEHRAPAVFWEGAGPERWVKRGPAGRAVPPWGVCVLYPLTASGGPASPAHVCGLFSSSRPCGTLCWWVLGSL